MEVLVRVIEDVIDHPKADRLSIIRILGYEAISNKNEDGSHKFVKGEPVVYVPEAAILPDDVLKEQGFWKEEKSIGMLAGPRGNRVKALRLRDRLSQGLLFKVTDNQINRGDSKLAVTVGQDVADFYGITKYEPKIPAGMDGEFTSVIEMTFDYDIENSQNFIGFLDNDEVEVTEKLHGTLVRVTFVPGLNRPDLFGEGDLGIATKRSGIKGQMLKNSRENLGPLWQVTWRDRLKEYRAKFVHAAWKLVGKRTRAPRHFRNTNLYVRVAMENDLINKVREFALSMGGCRVDLFGEIYGAGVQDLHYSTEKPQFRAFDIAINKQFANSDEKARWLSQLGVDRVPVLYRGPWDETVLVSLRDGVTELGGKNIREGIVITATGDQSKRLADDIHRLRPILKMVSPNYLVRSGEATEYS